MNQRKTRNQIRREKRQELAATDKGVYFRLMDGRAGLLMMGPRKRGYETDLVARAIVQSRGMC